MKTNTKKVVSLITSAALLAGITATACACEAKPDKNVGASTTPYATDGDFSDELYSKLQYIDSVASDRDCIAGENFKFTQKWITWELMKAGYKEEEVVKQPVTFSLTRKNYYQESTIKTRKGFIAMDNCETDGKKYAKSGNSYTEDEEGEYVKVTSVTTPNLVVTDQGKSNKQIIVGAHYDGDGTGDNGSGIALALTVAQHLKAVEQEYTVKFVFFTAEEYGCYGSTAYANAMSDDEVANTLYMVNLDSLVCGDYCYLYGGVQDNATKTVSKTEAFDNAMKVASALGLSFKCNPWTYDHLSPEDEEAGVPSYASPSTGNWSDHKGFKNKGIPYLYMEATNWEIPDYTGYGETYLVGMLMNTANDYLEYINKYFPGRIKSHFSQFSQLLWALVNQTDVAF